MTVHFYLRFSTKLGQQLRIVGSLNELGNNAVEKAVDMQFLSAEFWHLAIEIPNGAKFAYKYILVYENGYQVAEAGDDKEIDLSKATTAAIHTVDTWNHAGSYENVFFTAPFQQTLLPSHQTKTRKKTSKSYTHIFKVKAPLLQKNEQVCVVGNGLSLGDWGVVAPYLMENGGNWWVAKLNIPREEFPLQYKYGIYNAREKKFIRFEEGNNRNLFGEDNTDGTTIIHDGFLRVPNNTWRAAGVSVPVFSLRSKSSFGVGEFTDLKLMVDWAVKTGIKLLQILPINDTSATQTWTDSYPYAAISAFALHPIYINLEEVAGKKYYDLVKPLKKKQRQLNDLEEIDYEQVMKLKLSALKELFALQKEEFLNEEGFHIFFQKNQDWLIPYAAFCCLRDKNASCDFSKWKQHSSYNKEAIEKFVSPRVRHYDQIVFQYFIQYHLHLQLVKAAAYAHRQGVILKGDIPIGIYRHSCDAWMLPELFNMNVQAGAPPDDFATRGQNWGFPTYNWEMMEKDGFAWWKQRFDEMSNYFDAFRIDHILGFFRIWSIPVDAVEGIMGRFVPALPVHINEFYERNIWFDYNRYTRPFIADHVLYETFGDLAVFVREEYLIANEWGQLEIKADFNSQKKVEEYFAELEKNDHNNRVKQGLFDLISNVVLIEEGGSNGSRFHFRIAMDNTSSFRSLEANTRQQLKELYVNYFFQRQDDFWKREAMHKLPALKASTNMLICGEDLGMVPSCVPDVMQQLGILSLEIQRMPKDAQKSFFHPNDAPYLSVVTPGTHDMSTIRGWWEEDRQQTQRFYNYELGQWGDAPFFCEAWINRAIILQHLHSPAMWSIFQIQDLLGMSDALRRQNPNQERINVPANPKHYWRYRMHIALEQLIKEKAFNQEFKEYIIASGRGE
jgi:4-alpha-glucanotransferase